MKARVLLRTFLLCGVAWGGVRMARPANAASSSEAEIVEVDAKSLKFSTTQNGQIRTFTVGRFVDVSINGQKSTFEELEPGLKVKVTAATDGVAIRILANGIKTQAVGTKPPLGAGAVMRQLKANVSGDPLQGYAIGDVRKGTTLSFKHVSGKWKSPGKDVSPDESAEEIDKLAVALPAENGKPGQTLAVLPPGTAKKPFIFVADKDFAGLVLRINADKLTGNHGGAVEYAVKVLPR